MNYKGNRYFSNIERNLVQHRLLLKSENLRNQLILVIAHQYFNIKSKRINDGKKKKQKTYENKSVAIAGFVQGQ